MPECDYCGESVSENRYLDHLREEHYEELGRIDRRRVGGADAGDDDGLPIGALALVGIVVGTLALIAYLAFFAGGSGGGGTNGAAGPAALEDLPENGDPALLEGVEQFPSEGTQHVSGDTQVNYNTSPPTSGAHYSSPASAGFYGEGEAPAAGNLVHALEHGAVVVYYDPGALSAEQEEHLRSLTEQYTGTWASVIAVPTSAADVDSPVVLTAWRHVLRLDDYDEDSVEAFLAEFLGRGPENPIR
ncbi:DUF3105 domain-containing protein [Halomarina litorea]|uniref:DUF3105 domain-containing protein n=1 Tax=Halomarina litorea TaxID=2961595 RepID=UPI0020C31E48|nr:DUF3105 domain-containing protein [Halomarina sp. BCD28]